MTLSEQVELWNAPEYKRGYDAGECNWQDTALTPPEGTANKAAWLLGAEDGNRQRRIDDHDD